VLPLGTTLQGGIYLLREIAELAPDGQLRFQASARLRCKPEHVSSAVPSTPEGAPQQGEVEEVQHARLAAGVPPWTVGQVRWAAQGRLQQPIGSRAGFVCSGHVGCMGMGFLAGSV